MDKKLHVNCITINTDASFDCKHKVGGYAFYIISDVFKIKKSGMFKKQPSTAMEAEMMCMANALHTLLLQKELPSANLIIINSDCLYSFQHIKRKSKNEIGKKVADILREVRLKASFKNLVMPKYQFRHVKAHSGKQDSRSFVNDWCDKEAKFWMRKAKSLIEIKNKESWTANLKA